MKTNKIVESLNKYSKCHNTRCGNLLCEDCEYRFLKEDVEAVCLAAEILDKYRWHDLQKNPDDLPEDGERIIFYTKGFNDKYGSELRYWTGTFIEGLSAKWFYNDDAEMYVTRGMYEAKEEVIAWRYIEPFEEGE